jgi:hypothetical protein
MDNSSMREWLAAILPFVYYTVSEDVPTETPIALIPLHCSPFFGLL